MMKAVNNVMKRFIMMLVCAVAMCSGCTHFSNGEIECYEVEAFGHAVHSEDCQCKNNK